jgi:hypothetical protein
MKEWRPETMVARLQGNVDGKKILYIKYLY